LAPIWLVIGLAPEESIVAVALCGVPPVTERHQTPGLTRSAISMFLVPAGSSPALLLVAIACA
jgi:hypothetical protein